MHIGGKGHKYTRHKTHDKIRHSPYFIHNLPCDPSIPLRANILNTTYKTCMLYVYYITLDILYQAYSRKFSDTRRPSIYLKSHRRCPFNLIHEVALKGPAPPPGSASVGMTKCLVERIRKWNRTPFNSPCGIVTNVISCIRFFFWFWTALASLCSFNYTNRQMSIISPIFQFEAAESFLRW